MIVFFTADTITIFIISINLKEVKIKERSHINASLN